MLLVTHAKSNESSATQSNFLLIPVAAAIAIAWNRGPRVALAEAAEISFVVFTCAPLVPPSPHPWLSVTVHHIPPQLDIRVCCAFAGIPGVDPVVTMGRAAWDYLETRLTNNCSAPLHCAAQYKVAELAQIFNPSFAATSDASGSRVHRSVERGQANCSYGRRFEEGSSCTVQCSGLVRQCYDPALRQCYDPPALYRAMFTKLQAAALSDGIQSTLRLRYNDRAVG